MAIRRVVLKLNLVGNWVLLSVKKIQGLSFSHCKPQKDCSHVGNLRVGKLRGYHVLGISGRLNEFTILYCCKLEGRKKLIER